MKFEQFTEYFGELCEYFGKPPVKLAIESWYDFASDEGLTAGEFQQAAKSALGGCKFMPTQDEFLALLKGSSDDRAMAELDRYRAERYDEISQPARLAMSSLGGVSAFRSSQNPDRFRADFCRAFARFERSGGDDRRDERRVKNIADRLAAGVSIDQTEQKILTKFLGGAHES